MKKLTLLLGSIFLFSSCIYDYEDYVEKRDESYFPKIELLPLTGALANGKDSLRVRVIFNGNPNREFAKVNFSVTEGVFYENNKAEFTSSRINIKDGEFFISASIKTTTNKGMHFLKVEIPEVYSRLIDIHYLPSFPISIQTTKSKPGVKRTFNDEIQLIAQLKAQEGFPHQGTVVEFIVADSLSSNSSHYFRALTTTDGEGQASVFFSPGEFQEYTGPLHYTALAENEKGEIISASGVFQVVEPE